METVYKENFGILVHNVFIRTNRHAIAMKFICLSVWDAGRVCTVITMVHIDVYLSLWLDSLMFLAP